MLSLGLTGGVKGGRGGEGSHGRGDQKGGGNQEKGGEKKEEESKDEKEGNDEKITKEEETSCCIQESTFKKCFTAQAEKWTHSAGQEWPY